MLTQKNTTHSTYKGRIALQATAFNGDEYLVQKCQLQKHNSDCALCRKSDNSEINAAQHAIACQSAKHKAGMFAFL